MKVKVSAYIRFLEGEDEIQIRLILRYEMVSVYYEQRVRIYWNEKKQNE
jgi:hypothetical protein